MKSKALAAVSTLSLSAIVGVMSGAPSYAEMIRPHQLTSAAASLAPAPYAGPVCEGWGASVSTQPQSCNVSPYTTHSFQYHYTTSYWGMNPDQDTAPGGAWSDCTNYVAFVESTVYGVATPRDLPGNATDWAVGARADGYVVNHTPTVGSVAQWYANDNNGVIGSDGHVAIVEGVGPNESYIVVSQDNWHSDTDYFGWATILNAPSRSGAEPWPDNFIHYRSGGQGSPSTLSYTQPDRLIQSTGNLYWTADHISGSTTESAVYRASKGNVPGREQVLYEESYPTTSPAPVDFEAITYANVGGNWYGYFVANYPARDESQIKRVPLTGGAAVVLATSPGVIGIRDLVTDGSYLYWADALGVRKMAIGGGAIQTLASGETFSHLGLDGSVLYYSSANSILDVPTAGGSSGTVVTTDSPVTALYPPSSANGLLWGQANGEVESFEGDIYYQIQSPVVGVSITSVSVAGDYVIWGNCYPKWCEVDGRSDGGSGSVVSVATTGVPVSVQGDTGAWYWGDSVGLEKSVL